LDWFKFGKQADGNITGASQEEPESIDYPVNIPVNKQ
jgi:hypothetical protein